MLGFYITKHPLARFERLLNAYSTCKISEFVGMPDGKEVLIGGLISRAKITVTRQKAEKMAIISLEDLNNFVEVLVFPKTYRKVSELVKEDNLVYVQGKLNRREEDPKIIAEDIILLEKVKEMFTKSVLIKLGTVGLENQVMEQIKDIMARYKGKTPVLIDLISPEGRKIRLSIDKEMAVSPSDEFMREVEMLIGEGNVKFLTR